MAHICATDGTSLCHLWHRRRRSLQCHHADEMGDEGGAEAANGVGDNGLGGQFAIAEGVEHGGVGAEESAPTHANGREDGDGIAIDPALPDEVGDKAEGRAYGAKGGDGEGYLVGVGEAEEEAEEARHLVGQGGQGFYALVGGAGVCAVGGGAEGEYHDEGGDDEHTGDDGQADIDSGLASVEQRVEGAQEDGLLLLVLGLDAEGFLRSEVDGGLLGVLGIGAQDEALHHAGGDDTAAEGSEESDEGLDEVALANHEDDDDEPHAEGGAEVGEGDVLILAEVGGEAAVLGQGDDGGVVGQEGHDGAERGHAGETEEGAHEGAEECLEEIDNAELDEEFAEGAGDDADGHQVETGVEEEVEGGVHDGVEHRGSAHAQADEGEHASDDGEADECGEVTGFHGGDGVMRLFSEYIDAAGEANVDLVLAVEEGSVGVTLLAPGVAVVGVEPDEVVPTAFQGLVLESAAEAGNLGAGEDAVVGRGVRTVMVVGALGEEMEMVVGAIVEFAHEGEVAEEPLLMAPGTVHEVELDVPMAAEAEEVAQGQITDVAPRVGTDGVEAPHGVPPAVVTVPHEVVGVEVGLVGVERTLAGLGYQLVVVREVVGEADAPLVAGDVVPELAAEVEVDGGTVVLVAADGDDLLSGRNGDLGDGMVGEVEPVGGVEEVHVAAELIHALAVAVGELAGELSLQDNVEILAAEAALLIDLLAVQQFGIVVSPTLYAQVNDVGPTVLLRITVCQRANEQGKRHQKSHVFRAFSYVFMVFGCEDTKYFVHLLSDKPKIVVKAMDTMQHIIIDDTLRRISEQYGFSSLSHFTRYVQNNLGVKPSTLRE